VNLAHIGTNLGHLLVPLLAILSAVHLVRGKHRHAFWTVVGGAVVVALLLNPAQDGHLMTQLGNGVMSTISQLLA
jgi:hypothetical protein